jgi:hypothetical protein
MKRRCNRSGLSGREQATVVSSAYGDFAVTLIRVDGGVHVERSHAGAGRPRLIELMRFVEQESFDRWCEFDRLRFMDPKLAMDVRRSGHALFAAEQ